MFEFRNENSQNPHEKYYIIYKILNAADYGVPQKRKRFVLHAFRWDIYEKLLKLNCAVSLPKPTHSDTGENGLKKWKTISETIFDLPPIEAGQNYIGPNTIFNHKCAKLSDLNIERIKIVRNNGGSRISLPPELTLKCHKDYSGHSDVYGVMNPDEPAPTMTGGCLSYSKGRFGHPTQDRAISIREAARIQTFPDDFVFSESVTQSGLQIGNAVPVDLVKASADNLMKYFNILLNNK